MVRSIGGSTLREGGWPFLQSVAGGMSAAIGRHGLAVEAMASRLDRLSPKLHALQRDYTNDSLPLLRIIEAEQDILDAEAALARLSQGASTIVFFGTGGSSLGGQTLAQLAGWNIPGFAEPAERRRPRTRFYDNLDATTLGAAFATLDAKSTRFVLISKSGSTAETLTQAIAAISAVRDAEHADRIPEHFLALTEPEMPGRRNGLRELCKAYSIPILDHHPGIGGRFSILSNVSLLPALARGLDVRALRKGAKSVVDALCSASHPRELSAAVGAAFVVGLAEDRGVGIQVMMPYSDRLGRFAHWFVQLWAESLGKSGKGTTPLACLGPLDQHSQLQLFMDGPRQHLVTIIRTPSSAPGPRLDPVLADLAGIGFLGGRSVGDLVDAQSKGVADALTQAGRPVRTFDIPELDMFAVGALLMHFMLETIFAAELLGVDPFDQPAVELAKTLARQSLAKS